MKNKIDIDQLINILELEIGKIDILDKKMTIKTITKVWNDFTGNRKNLHPFCLKDVPISLL